MSPLLEYLIRAVIDRFLDAKWLEEKTTRLDHQSGSRTRRVLHLDPKSPLAKTLKVVGVLVAVYLCWCMGMFAVFFVAMALQELGYDQVASAIFEFPTGSFDQRFWYAIPVLILAGALAVASFVGAVIGLSRFFPWFIGGTRLVEVGPESVQRQSHASTDDAASVDPASTDRSR